MHRLLVAFCAFIALMAMSVQAYACNCDFSATGRQGAILRSAQAASGGDPAKLASLLRMSQLETSFGCYTGGGSRPQNNGPAGYTYNYDSGTGAFGGAQFTGTTWNRTIAQNRVAIGQAINNALANTTDPTLTRQLTEFRAYVNGTGGQAYTWRHYAGQIGPSMIMGDILASRENGASSAAQTIYSATGGNASIDPYAVSSYVGHNVGLGEMNRFMAAVRNGNMDATVNTIFTNPASIRNNPSIWCRSVNNGVCDPLTVSEAMANITSRGVSGQCVQQAFQMLGLSFDTSGIPAGGPPFTPQIAVTPDPNLQIQVGGGLPNTVNEAATCKENGLSRWCESRRTGPQQHNR